MTFELPTAGQLKEIGDEIGFDMDDRYIAEVLSFMEPFADAYNAIDDMPDSLPEVKYPRGDWRRPASEENRHGAWYVKAEIKGSREGILSGKTVAIKDSACVAGIPMMNGASVLEGYVPEMDATVVTRILDADGTVTGKAVCEYFCVSGGSATSASGVVHSARNPGYTPGGSSTGSAALVAAGEVDMALGGDQAGSIRIPAAFSGVVGLKPTFGLVPYTGIMGIENTIDHAGPITANVADNALFLQAMAGEDGFDPRQRVPHVDRYVDALEGNARRTSRRRSERRIRALRFPPRCGCCREGRRQPSFLYWPRGRKRFGSDARGRSGDLGRHLHGRDVQRHVPGQRVWLERGGRLPDVAGGRHERRSDARGGVSRYVQIRPVVRRHVNRSYGSRYYAKARTSDAC